MDGDFAHRPQSPASRKWRIAHDPRPGPALPNLPRRPVVVVAGHADQPLTDHPIGPYIGPFIVGMMMLRADSATRKHFINHEKIEIEG